MRRAQDRSGSTFIELMVVSGTAMLLIGSFLSLTLMSQRTLEQMETSVSLSGNTRAGMARMTKELHSAERASIEIAPDGTSLSFRVPGHAAVIRYELGGPHRSQLLRTENGVSSIVCADVQKLAFSPNPFSGEVVTVTLRLEKGSRSQHAVGSALTNRMKARN